MQKETPLFQLTVPLVHILNWNYPGSPTGTIPQGFFIRVAGIEKGSGLIFIDASTAIATKSEIDKPMHVGGIRLSSGNLGYRFIVTRQYLSAALGFDVITLFPKAEKFEDKPVEVMPPLVPEHPMMTIPGWIKCSDRLPEIGESVIIWYRRGYRLFSKRGWSQGSKPDHWVNPYGGRIEMEDITHWMPVVPGPEGA